MPLDTKTAILRQAQRVIDTAQAAASGSVAVLWQKADEPAEVFANRATTARTRLQAAQLLVVVCAFDVVPPSRGICVIELPPIMLGLFDKPTRYRCCYGGRGAGRSWSFARVLIAKSLERKVRILCARELQNSIADSIHTLLSDQIDLLGLGAFFEIQNTTIISRNGSEFIFAGLRTNVSKIKSLEGAGLVYIEEAAGVSDGSWQTLIPTIRAPGSEIYLAFNPDLESDPTYQRFVVHPPDNSIVIKTSYADNPRLPEPLRAELEYLRRVDPDAFEHVWEGSCVTHSDAQIFRGKYSVESFEPAPGWDGPYHGLDLGFAADPSVLTKCWVFENALYIEREAWGLHVDIDKLPRMLAEVPDSAKYTIRCDSARPETVSYLQHHGFPNTVSVDKWPDSVADGISRMRAFEKIVIHPSCEHTIQEFRLYSYKVDRLSGDVLPDIIDKNNHCIDSIRYAISPLIKLGGAGAFLNWMGAQVAVETKQKADALVKKPGVIVTELNSPWH